MLIFYFLAENFKETISPKNDKIGAKTCQNFYSSNRKMNIFCEDKKDFTTNINEKSLFNATNYKPNFGRKMQILEGKEKVFELKINIENKFNTNTMCLRKEELKEEKYFENIQFNYMKTNFNRFKDFIDRPNIVIEPPPMTTAHSCKRKVMKNNSMNSNFNFLSKFRNIAIKKEIFKKK